MGRAAWTDWNEAMHEAEEAKEAIERAHLASSKARKAIGSCRHG